MGHSEARLFKLESVAKSAYPIRIPNAASPPKKAKVGRPKLPKGTAKGRIVPVRMMVARDGVEAPAPGFSVWA